MEIIRRHHVRGDDLHVTPDISFFLVKEICCQIKGVDSVNSLKYDTN